MVAIIIIVIRRFGSREEEEGEREGVGRTGREVLSSVGDSCCTWGGEGIFPFSCPNKIEEVRDVVLLYVQSGHRVHGHDQHL